MGHLTHAPFSSATLEAQSKNDKQRNKDKDARTRTQSSTSHTQTRPVGAPLRRWHASSPFEPVTCLGRASSVATFATASKLGVTNGNMALVRISKKVAQSDLASRASLGHLAPQLSSDHRGRSVMASCPRLLAGPASDCFKIRSKRASACSEFGLDV